MIVVADTSPLNYLILLGKVGVLQQMYGRILVPPAVRAELKHSGAPEEVRIWANSPPAWLEEVRVRAIDSTLGLALGAGEREAISLAAEVHADILILDDFQARTAAQNRNLPVAGTLAVLREASLRGYLSFDESVDRICEFGFRVSRKTLADALEQYGGMKRRQ